MSPSPDKQQYPPVTVEKLRHHFQVVYGLSPNQAEVMIGSSAKSLSTAVGDLAEKLAAGVEGQQLVACFHGLKGLFLNMGESSWAEYARQLEADCQAGNTDTVHEAVEILRRGVAEVMSLSSQGTDK